MNLQQVITMVACIIGACIAIILPLIYVLCVYYRDGVYTDKHGMHWAVCAQCDTPYMERSTHVCREWGS